MINEFKVGTNFDLKLLDVFADINNLSNNGNKITEIYGSDRGHHQLAARPAFRLPEVDEDTFKKYIAEAKSKGIAFNYTMNSIIPFGFESWTVKKAEC